jgi:hypothetical protein
MEAVSVFESAIEVVSLSLASVVEASLPQANRIRQEMAANKRELILTCFIAIF